MKKVPRRFLKAWERATGGPIIKLPSGCYTGPCLHCGNHTLVVGLASNPCGGLTAMKWTSRLWGGKH